MDIVVITDKWFIMPTGVMMYSVCVNNPDTDIVFHVIVDESVTLKDKERLTQTIAKEGKKSKVRFYAFDGEKCSWFPKGNGRADITYATYYRLFLTEILPQTLDKVLYMDGDIIVRHSLRQLWETDISGYAVAAVTDYHVESMLSTFDRLQYLRDYGYFNAGVLLINLNFWRTNHVHEDFIQFLSNYADKILFHDQDVLNVLFKDKKLMLPVKYNLQSAFLWKKYEWLKEKKDVKEAFTDPVIVHFTGSKPWDEKNDSHPFSKTFFKYQHQTLWKGQKGLDRRPWRIRLRGYVGNVLRLIKILPPPRKKEWIQLSPID